MNRKLSIRWSKEWAIAILFFGPQINYYLASLLSMNNRQTLTVPVYVILYGIGAFSYLKVLGHKKCFISLVILAASLILSILINGGVVQHMLSGYLYSSGLIVLLFAYFPVFLLLVDGVDFNKLMRISRGFCHAALIVALFTFGRYIIIRKTTPSDYMSFAYMMMSPILFCFIQGTEGSLWDLILSALGGFIILIVGCRGAVISIAVFFLLYMLGYYMPKGGKGVGIRKLLVILLIVAVAVFSEQILTLISYGLNRVGLTSRTVNKLIAGSGAFIESEGRQAIWRQALENIGFFGKGLFGDRTVIINEYGQATYAHNLLLEIMVDFGLAVGVAVLICFIVLFIRAYKYSLKMGSSLLIKVTFVMISIVFAKHMISTSFLTSFDFWFYFGLAVCIVTNRDKIMQSGHGMIEKENAQ